MTSRELMAKLRSTLDQNMPLPGHGETPERHRRLLALGRMDLSLARLAEAHWDAVAILAEAGRKPETGAVYGVWASEKQGQELRLSSSGELSGSKMFCSGAGLIDRALVTAETPKPLLIDVDLAGHPANLIVDSSSWKTAAFSETQTAKVTFNSLPTAASEMIGVPGWYLERPGFWHGACGPAACWAGGAIGLVDFAKAQTRNDSHTLAHLGAMQSLAWALESYLDTAGHEIDANPKDAATALMRALTVRHLVEQACTEILRRFARAYGPHPLAANENISRRYHELDLYLRQSHAERDLESLGMHIKRLE